MKRMLAILLCIVLCLAPMCINAAAAQELSLERVGSVDDIVDGGTYVFIMPGIQDVNTVYGDFALKTQTLADPKTALAYTKYQKGMDLTGLEWVITDNGTGYTMMAKGGDNDGKYLSVGAGTLSLSDTPKEVHLVQSGSKFRIVGAPDRAYCLRFTNSATDSAGKKVSGFISANSTSSSEFELYWEAGTGTTGEAWKEMDPPTTEPLLVIGCISDLHIDYGIQNWNPPMRQGTIDACRELAKENLSVLLVGGDITSKNSGQSWTQSKYNEVLDQVVTTTKTAVASGRVLYVTGNHDYAIGGTGFNSGDYSGIMKEDVGEFVNALYMDEAKNYLLAYHYVIDGFHFIMINTPYSGGDNHGDYVYTSETVTWMESELASIGKEKTVFVMGHYPLRDSKGLTAESKGMSANNDLNDRFKAALLNYPNAVYLYGHDHGGPHIDMDVLERVTPYTADGAPIYSRKVLPTGFISSFVGSMGYYKGALSETQPEIVQALVIKVYEDRLVFEMKNYGEKTGSAAEPRAYTVARTIAADKGDDPSDPPAGETPGGNEDPSDPPAGETPGGNEDSSDPPAGETPGGDEKPTDPPADEAPDTGDDQTAVLVFSILIFGTAILSVRLWKSRKWTGVR